MNDYIIAIPSYDRSETLKEKTLNYLERQNIPYERIFIFVANEKEFEIYNRVINNEKIKIVVGELGLYNQRNFIVNYFEENKYIVSIDDDIEDIEIKVNGDKYDKEVGKIELDGFIKKSYDRLISNKLYIWGVSMNSNPFFSYKKETTDLRFVATIFYGFINRKEMIQRKYRHNAGEDIVKCLEYYVKDGGIIRFN